MKPHEIAEVLGRYAPLRPIVMVAGPPPVRRVARVDARFVSVVEAVVYQQLAGKAAAAIFGRLVEQVGPTMTPAAMLQVSDRQARAIGLSGAKFAALRDLALATTDGRVDFVAHGRKSDDAIVAELVTVRGIGPWTAQMYLMHTMGRHDVWPVLDYGVRNGWSLLHGRDDLIAPKDLARAADHLSPHRSAVAWYCWRAVDELRANGR
jgi:DNA-3-methyladenine glycosylase II